MKNARIAICLAVVFVMAVGNFASADIFGTGGNQFTIDFVPISGSTNPTSGYGIVNNDYRMGTYEISNDQWNKFKAANGAVTGTPSNAYDSATYWTGTKVPTNNVSWYEAAQFVNYLNISTNHQAAYKFTGTQGTSNYTFATWVSTDIGYNAGNPYRNSNAYYFLPTEDEWVKAANWNGTSLQHYPTIGNTNPTQTGWNYYDNGYALNPGQLWNVKGGSQEINGTYNMLGNVCEWMESPDQSGSYRGVRGGSYKDGNFFGRTRSYYDPYSETDNVGFRVASVPEPATMLLFGLGGLILRKRRVGATGL